MVQAPDNLRTFQALRQVVHTLRGPDGCPWDKEQDHRSLTPYAIEEAFELVDAIELGSREDLIEELGDCLLQVVLHAEIAEQAGEFSIEDVVEVLNRKMIHRHPHVFAEQKVQNSAEVLNRWAAIKDQEKSNKPRRASFGLPTGLPALQKAQKIGNKTEAYAFDWENALQVLAKVNEELAELTHEIHAQSTAERLRHELGDVLFSVAQLARHLHLEAEQSLREANTRFEKRFFTLLELAEKKGWIQAGASDSERRHQLAQLPLEDKEVLWQEVKNLEKST